MGGVSVRVVPWWVVACALLVWPPVVRADDVCTKSGRPIPHCVSVSSPKFDLKALETLGSAVSCPHATPFYWGTWTDTKTSSAVSAVTNPFVEAPSRGAWTITNWTTSPQAITLTIGCSTASPSGIACDWKICTNPLTGCKAEACQVCLTQFACRWQLNKAAGCNQNVCVEMSVYRCNDGQQHECQLNVERPDPPPPGTLTK